MIFVLLHASHARPKGYSTGSHRGAGIATAALCVKFMHSASGCARAAIFLCIFATESIRKAGRDGTASRTAATLNRVIAAEAFCIDLRQRYRAPTKPPQMTDMLHVFKARLCNIQTNQLIA
jgi:hypothetical protein